MNRLENCCCHIVSKPVCAVAAALGTSLTDRNSPLHIYPDETGNLDLPLELSGKRY